MPGIHVRTDGRKPAAMVIPGSYWLCHKKNVYKFMFKWHPDVRNVKYFPFERELLKVMRRIIKSLPGQQGQRFSTQHLMIAYNYTFCNRQDKMFAMIRFQDRPEATVHPQAFILTINVVFSPVKTVNNKESDSPVGSKSNYIILHDTGSLGNVTLNKSEDANCQGNIDIKAIDKVPPQTQPSETWDESCNADDTLSSERNEELKLAGEISVNMIKKGPDTTSNAIEMVDEDPSAAAKYDSPHKSRGYNKNVQLVSEKSLGEDSLSKPNDIYASTCVTNEAKQMQTNRLGHVTVSDATVTLLNANLHAKTKIVNETRGVVQQSMNKCEMVDFSNDTVHEDVPTSSNAIVPEEARDCEFGKLDRATVTITDPTDLPYQYLIEKEIENARNGALHSIPNKHNMRQECTDKITTNTKPTNKFHTGGRMIAATSREKEEGTAETRRFTLNVDSCGDEMTRSAMDKNLYGNFNGKKAGLNAETDSDLHETCDDEYDEDDFKLTLDPEEFTSRSSNITDLVMEGLMFTIRQDEDNIKVVEQRTKLEMDEVLENSEKVETKQGEKGLVNSSLLQLQNLITKIQVPKGDRTAILLGMLTSGQEDVKHKKKLVQSRMSEYFPSKQTEKLLSESQNTALPNDSRESLTTVDHLKPAFPKVSPRRNTFLRSSSKETILNVNKSRSDMENPKIQETLNDAKSMDIVFSNSSNQRSNSAESSLTKCRGLRPGMKRKQICPDVDVNKAAGSVSSNKSIVKGLTTRTINDYSKSFSEVTFFNEGEEEAEEDIVPEAFQCEFSQPMHIAGKKGKNRIPKLLGREIFRRRIKGKEPLNHMDMEEGQEAQVAQSSMKRRKISSKGKTLLCKRNLRSTNMALKSNPLMNTGLAVPGRTSQQIPESLNALELRTETSKPESTIGPTDNTIVRKKHPNTLRMVSNTVITKDEMPPGLREALRQNLSRHGTSHERYNDSSNNSRIPSRSEESISTYSRDACTFLMDTFTSDASSSNTSEGPATLNKSQIGKSIEKSYEMSSASTINRFPPMTDDRTSERPATRQTTGSPQRGITTPKAVRRTPRKRRQEVSPLREIEEMDPEVLTDEVLEKMFPSTDGLVPIEATRLHSSGDKEDITEDFHKELIAQKKRKFVLEQKNLRERKRRLSEVRSKKSNEIRIEMWKLMQDITLGAKVVLERIDADEISKATCKKRETVKKK